MSPLLALAVAAGVVLGLGLWTLAALVPRIGSARLATRIAPYVADVSPAAREHAARRSIEPMSFFGGLLAPVLRRAAAAVTAVLGGDGTVQRRLRQSGSTITVEAFRGRQLLSAAVGAALGIGVAALLVRSSPTAPVVPVAIAVAFGIAGLLAPEQLLSRSARIRRARIAAELPTVLEFLTLSLSAGEGILDSLRRVARSGNGDLAIEIARVVAQVHAGVPLADALHRLADEIQLPALTRTVDQLTAALERGAPLVDVLRAQVQDSRDESKRLLLESAGRKELAMLVPLVFLILPVTVAFAIWPGLLVLRLGF